MSKTVIGDDDDEEEEEEEETEELELIVSILSSIILALIITSNKSSEHEFATGYFLLRSMSSTKDFEISLSNFQESLFFLVGRNLKR